MELLLILLGILFGITYMLIRDRLQEMRHDVTYLKNRVELLSVGGLELRERVDRLEIPRGEGADHG